MAIGANTEEVGIDLIARNMASQAVRDVGRDLGGLRSQVMAASESMKTIGRNIRGLGTTLTTHLTLPIAGAGAAITTMSKDFEHSLDKIVGLVGVAREDVEAWKPEILALGEAAGKGPNELAEALFFVTSAGFRGAEAMDVLQASARASAAGLGETAGIADAVTSAVNAYGAGNLSATESTDILIASVREGKFEAAGLAPVLGNILPIASKLGVGFDEVGAAMAAMSRTGTDVAIGSTQLQAFFSSLLKTGKDAEEAMADVGISADSLRKTLREQGLIATIELLDSKLGDNEEAWARIFPNVRALRGLLNITGQDGEVVAGIFDRMANTTGSLDAAFGAVSESSGFKMDQAMTQMQNTLIELGDTVLPFVADIFQELSGVLKTFREWWSGLDDDTRGLIVRIAAFAAAAGPVLVVVGMLVSGLGAILGVVGALMSPIVLIAGALLLLATNAGLFGSIFDGVLGTVRTMLPAFLEQLGSWIASLGEWIVGTALPQAGEFLLSMAQAFIDWIAPMIPPFLEALAEWGRDLISWVLNVGLPMAIDALADFAVAFIDWISPMAAKLPDALLEFAFTVVEWLANDAVPMILPAMANLAGLAIGKFIEIAMHLPGLLWDFLINGLLPALANWGPKLLGSVLKLAGTIVDGIVKGLASLPGKIWDVVREAFTNLRIDIGPFHISSRGVTIDLPKIELPSFATGAWRLPSDMVAQVHAGEMIIPADIAARLRGEVGATTGARDVALSAAPGQALTVVVYNHFDPGSVRSAEDIHDITREQTERIRLLGFTPTIRSGSGVSA